MIDDSRSTWIRRKVSMFSTTLWKFILGIVVFGLIAVAGVMIAATWIGRDIVHEMYSDKSYTVLRNVTDLMARSEIGVEMARIQHLENSKKSLQKINIYTADIFDFYLSQVDKGLLSSEEAKEKAFEILNGIVRRDKSLGFVFDRHQRLVVHPNPAFRGYSAEFFPDATGRPVFQELAKKAANAVRGEQVYTLYPWFNEITLRQEFKLTAALYYEPWDLVICADVFMNDVEQDLELMSEINLNEIRARVGEIIIGESGYLFFFDQDCNMIGHPTLKDKSISHLMEPASKDLLCQALIHTSEQPWGKNRLSYVWDRPDDKGNFDYSKTAWCTREAVTGWYVCASAYADELDSALPRFVLSIFLPSLAAIFLLGGVLAFFLKKLLNPVRQLVGVCDDVMNGDFSVRAPEKASGEMGFLCRNFNMMIHRLQFLRRKEEERRLQLENLNKDLEKRVEERTRDLRRETEKLREANKRLRELDEMKSAFLSSVSHELRTPLTSILGFATLIKREFTRNFLPLAGQDKKLEERGARITKNLDIIEHGGWRLTRLINDVLDLNKIESGRMKWNDGNVSAREIIENSVQAAQGEFVDKPGVVLKTIIKENLPVIRIDRDKMEQVMANLLTNAAKFTEKGKVEVIAGIDSGNLKVEVRDTGEGIAQDQLEKIFERFQQAKTDTKKGKPKGTGLGLTIAQQIVEHYQGKIWAKSRINQGTSIIFTLPLSEVGVQKNVH
ncbi:MAG: cache domain-containing protein [Desulfonatronovibrio sp.]